MNLGFFPKNLQFEPLPYNQAQKSSLFYPFLSLSPFKSNSKVIFHSVKGQVLRTLQF